MKAHKMEYEMNDKIGLILQLLFLKRSWAEINKMPEIFIGRGLKKNLAPVSGFVSQPD